MKKILFALLLALTPTHAALAVASATLETKIVDGQAVPAAYLFGTSRVYKTVGLSAFALATKNWSEAYAGPTYAPIPELELSMSFGFQQGTEGLEPRYATSLFAGARGFSVLAVTEFDHGGVETLWYNVVGSYQLVEAVVIGFHTRRFVGLGPHISATAYNTTLWASWMVIDPEGFGPTFNPSRVVLGLGYGF